MRTESAIEKMMDALTKSVDTSSGDGLIAVTIVSDFLQGVREEVELALSCNEAAAKVLTDWGEELELMAEEIEIREIIINLNENELHGENNQRNRET